MYCSDIAEPIFFLISSDIPKILYYSHIPSTLIALFIVFYILSKGKKNKSVKILLVTSVSFSLFSVLSLVTWTNIDSRIILFAWSLIGIIVGLLFISLIYFAYVFINKKDVSFNIKLTWFLVFLPLLFFVNQGVANFDLVFCEAIENPLYTNYYYILGLVSFIWVLCYSIYKIKKTNNANEKKQIYYISIGVSLFLTSFFVAGYFASLFDNFEFEQYGLFGMTIFMGFLTYLIVRFKAFNVKLLGAQALVWAMVILIGSQFLFIQSTTNKILNSVTFVIVSIAGLVLVRSVKSVDKQKELLTIANENQEALIHFITHQVKGYLTKSRNIFDAILNGDYGPVNKELKKVSQYGFESQTAGVQTVQNILRASNLKKGSIEFKKINFDLRLVINDLINEFRQKIQDKGLTLTEKISADPIFINGDLLSLKEVFKNLIDNSILYTPKGNLEITLEDQTNEIIFSVKDTGIGLTEKEKKTIFNEGAKGEESLKYNVDTSGYGLYIAKEIVNKHGGKISAKSEGRGKGSEFIVELPLK